MLKAVIFDLDGVIVDSEPFHFQSDVLTFRDYGMEISEEELIRYVGVSGTVMWTDFIRKYGIPDTLENIVAKQTAHKIELLREKPPQAVPGVLGLLESARKAGLRTAIASSSPRYFIDAMLNSLGIAGSFDAVVSGQDVQRSKPAPDIFLKAAELLGAKPSNCLVVEDAMLGVRAAKAAGMRCAGFANPHSGNQDLSAADTVVTDMGHVRLEDF